MELSFSDKSTITPKPTESAPHIKKMGNFFKIYCKFTLKTNTFKNVLILLPLIFSKVYLSPENLSLFSSKNINSSFNHTSKILKGDHKSYNS